jgi:hypothetical protein
VFGLRRKRDAYIDAFRGPAGERVLKDLARFCRASTSTFDPDARVHAFREGRREVWLRIQTMLNLPEKRVQELSEAEPDE